MKALDVIPLLTPEVVDRIEAVVQSKPKRTESYRWSGTVCTERMAGRDSAFIWWSLGRTTSPSVLISRDYACMHACMLLCILGVQSWVLLSLKHFRCGPIGGHKQQPVLSCVCCVLHFPIPFLPRDVQLGPFFATLLLASSEMYRGSPWWCCKIFGVWLIIRCISGNCVKPCAAMAQFCRNFLSGLQITQLACSVAWLRQRSFRPVVQMCDRIHPFTG